jgi:hypothetical protein
MRRCITVSMDACGGMGSFSSTTAQSDHPASHPQGSSGRGYEHAVPIADAHIAARTRNHSVCVSKPRHFAQLGFHFNRVISVPHKSHQRFVCLIINRTGKISTFILNNNQGKGGFALW